MINFQPKSGSVLWCDYRGFLVPEMIKCRPVIVLSRHKCNSKLLLVVPISTKEPIKPRYFNIPLPEGMSRTFFKGKRLWIKADMINVISIERLSFINKKKGGFSVDPNTLNQIRSSISTFYNIK